MVKTNTGREVKYFWGCDTEPSGFTNSFVETRDGHVEVYVSEKSVGLHFEESTSPILVVERDYNLPHWLQRAKIIYEHIDELSPTDAIRDAWIDYYERHYGPEGCSGYFGAIQRRSA